MSCRVVINITCRYYFIIILYDDTSKQEYNIYIYDLVALSKLLIHYTAEVFLKICLPLEV